MEVKNNSFDENTKIKILAKYLVTKGVSTALRLQKLLFMLRFEEVFNQNLNCLLYTSDAADECCGV